ncbi:MAG: TldD/PmbA family protein [Bacteriovoracaceae bacterium]|nr:TldD/PmbA family protein [Bacteriovoracaceae bacterium]
MSDLNNTVNKIIDMAKKKGAESDCILDKSNLLSLKAEDGELSEYKVSGSQVVGVRVIKDNRVGTSYSEAIDDQSLEFMVNQALENARFSKEDLNQKISVERKEEYIGTTDKINASDSTSLEDKTKFALELESKIKEKDSHVKGAPYNGFSEVEHTRLYVNSNGTLCQQDEKTFSCYTSALIEKDGKQSMHYHSSVARKFNKLDMNSVIDESFNHAWNLLDGSPIKTGNYRIIFNNDILHNFISNFGSLFSAKGAMNGVNVWKDKIGSSVATKRLTLKDNPTYEDAFTYCPFDDEGSLTRETTLIEDGVLKTFFHNTATADYFKTENTANASRSPKGTLGVNGTNMIISTGTDTENDLREDEYFEIISLQGLGSGSDVVSGDFSCAASGYLKKGDKVIQSVKGVTISGNYFKVLNEISGIGNTLHASSENTFFSPTIVFEGMTIGGQ